MAERHAGGDEKLIYYFPWPNVIKTQKTIITTIIIECCALRGAILHFYSIKFVNFLSHTTCYSDIRHTNMILNL